MKHSTTTILIASFLALSCASRPARRSELAIQSERSSSAAQPDAQSTASSAASSTASSTDRSSAQPATQLGSTRADADALYARKEWEAALALYRDELERAASDPVLLDRVAHCEHLLGRFEHSLAAWQELSRLRPRDPVAAYNVACANAQLGRRDAALAALERALGNGFKNLAAVENDPDLASLRGDPRLSELVRRARASVQPNAGPPAEIEQFAFWVGEWDVFGANGGRAGSSRVERILGGWVLLENWSGADGMNGKSFNSYDSARGSWRQHWVDDRGQALDFHDGVLENGVLTFHAKWKDASGAVIRRRMSFTNLGEQGVRQYSERSSDDGQSWQQEYELFYRRRAGG